MSFRGVVLVVCVVGAASGAGAQPAPEDASRPALAAVRAAGEIVLDGALDESAWADAAMASGFVQNDPREGEPATFDTQVRVLYDDDALYFGVFARDDEPGRLIANDLKKDFNVEATDGFRIVLDTFHDRRNGYQFATNPAGAKWDAQMANEGRENNVNWDGIWDVATRITETGWYAEIRIPFRTLRFDAGGQRWGMNFERRVRRLNEDSYWSPVSRIYDIQRVSLAGTVEGLRGLRPGKDLRVKPFLASSGSTIGRQAMRGDVDAGVDVKYGVATGLTWDFTVNTDFSQVEADEQQINLSRFSLFFPEKREFFLENSGIFQFGPSASGFGLRQQDMRMFFSRRIGLSDAGVAIPLLAGTRLTGRRGAYSLGAMSIQQREDGGVPSTNFTALRVRRDLFANSDVGAIVLNKEEVGARFNRVFGIDANMRFGLWTLYGFAARSVSPDAVLPVRGNEYATRAGFDYSSRTWQVQSSYSTIGGRFNNELGFVPRRGVDKIDGRVGPRLRAEALSRWVRQMQPHWEWDWFTHQDGGAVDTGFQGFHQNVSFQDGSNAEVGVNLHAENVLRPFAINQARGVRVAAGRHDFVEYFGFWNSDASAPVSLNARYSVGTFYDGYRRSYTVGPSMRLNEHLNAALSVQVQDIAVSGGEFVSTLVTGRVNYNFNTRMFVNALLQYNTDARQWSSNVRFNVIHRPLSDFFLVYNERRDERSGTLLDRAVIAKMTYLVAF